jgi:hypothetical protein
LRKIKFLDPAPDPELAPGPELAPDPELAPESVPAPDPELAPTPDQHHYLIDKICNKYLVYYYFIISINASTWKSNIFDDFL